MKYLLILFLFCSCSQKPLTATYRSELNSDVLNGALESAILELEEYNKESFLHSEDPDFTIKFIGDDLEDDVVGSATYGDVCTVRINTDFKYYADSPTSMGNLKIVLWHEIFHCMGGGHTEDFPAIMNKYAMSFQLLSPEVFKRYNDDLKRLRGI